MDKKKSVFETLAAINVGEYTKKKGNLNYLSWSWAWEHLLRCYPDASYSVKTFDNGLPFNGSPEFGFYVQTSITVDGITREMWLPVMDHRNQSLKQPDMCAVNKTIMRCLVKNVAMFGLGLYIYEGEDAPEAEVAAYEAMSVDDIIAAINETKSKAEMQKLAAKLKTNDLARNERVKVASLAKINEFNQQIIRDGEGN